MSYVDFVTPALEYAKEAVNLDSKERFAEAQEFYERAIEYFIKAVKHEKNESRKEQLREKCKELLSRVESIKKFLDEKSAEGTSSSGTVLKNKQSPGEDNVDQEKKKMKSQMSDAIVREKPNVHWDDIAGLDAAKEALQEAVILPIRFPHFFTGKREPWRGILLYGPPGTGKSYLAKAVATEANATFFSVSSSTLMSKWLGEAEKQVASLFEMAREHAPSIIFIDEVDSMCGARGDGENDASRRVKTEFLVQMQGVGHNDRGVLVLGATNLPYDLDPAIRRRFERRIYIPLPDKRARVRMFEIHVGDTPNCLSREDIEHLAELTEGYSGSDISVLTRNALMEPVRSLPLATHFKQADVPNPANPSEILTGCFVPCSPGDAGGFEASLMSLDPAKVMPPPVQLSDFLKALRTTRPSVSKEDIDVHVRFTSEFGQEG